MLSSATKKKGFMLVNKNNKKKTDKNLYWEQDHVKSWHILPAASKMERRIFDNFDSKRIVILLLIFVCLPLMILQLSTAMDETIFESQGI